jgi:hypothetical protein
MNADKRRSDFRSAFIRVHLWLLIIGGWHEAGAVFVVARFPDDDDLVDRDVARFAFVVTQMQDAHFHLEDFTTQARTGAAVDINLLADQFR